MKKCPTCKSVYSDDTLAFCLSDGTPLDATYESEKTLQLPNPIITDSAFSPQTTDIQPSQKSIATEVLKLKDERKGVSPIWIYSTIALLFLFLGGGLALFLSGLVFKENVSNQTTPTPQISPTSNNETVQTQNPSPTKTSESKTTQTPPIISENVTYRVVGVAANDVLYIRLAPGNTKSFAGKISPGTTGIKITGKAVKSGKSVWYPINYNGTTGWVNGKFIAKE